MNVYTAVSGRRGPDKEQAWRVDPLTRYSVNYGASINETQLVVGCYEHDNEASDPTKGG